MFRFPPRRKKQEERSKKIGQRKALREERFSCVRVARAHSTAILIFCCHKCHCEGQKSAKKEAQKEGKSTEQRDKKVDFRYCDARVLRGYIAEMLKHAHKSR